MIPRKTAVLHHPDRNILLRPQEAGDARAMFEAIMASRDELMPWMDWCTPDYSFERTVDWLEQQRIDWEEGTGYQFAIVDRQAGDFLGGCGINHINRTYYFANLGYWVRTDRTRSGIATEAAILTAQFGFQVLGLRRIEIVTAEDNQASRRVAEKTGATFEGILRRRLKIGDRNVDAAMHSLIPEDMLTEM